MQGTGVPATGTPPHCFQEELVCLTRTSDLTGKRGPGTGGGSKELYLLHAS